MRGLHCRMGWIIEFKIPICVKGGGGWEFIGMTELNKWTSSIRGHAGTPTVGLPNWLASSQEGYTDENKNKCLYIYTVHKWLKIVGGCCLWVGGWFWVRP